MTTFVPANQKIGEYDTKHVIQQLQEGLDLKSLRRYYMEYEKVKTSPYGKKLAIQMPYSIKNDTTQNRDEKCLLMTYDDKSTEEGVSMLLVWKCLLSE